MNTGLGEITVKDKRFNLLLSSETLQEGVARVAARMNKELEGKEPLFLAVLNGSFMFAADLMKYLRISCRISFIKFSSYSGMQSSGDVREIFGLTENIEGKTVVILEDIVDTGRTIQQLLETLQKRNPADVQIATLLHKPEADVCGIKPNYAAFEIPNEFVVGYGLDYDGLGRNLPEVYKVI
jgi:hypoxanthine phosphoribosyltransferase